MNLRIIAASLLLICATVCHAQEQGAEKVKIEPIDMNRAREIAAMMSDSPRGMSPTYKDRAVWDGLARQYPDKIKTMIARANKLLGSEWPVWDNPRYMRMFTHGESDPGKFVLQERFKWVEVLAIAETFENKGRFTAKLQMALDSIMAQETWVNPRNYKKETAGGMVELSTASASSDIASSMYMMDDKFSPEFRKKVLDQLYTRTFNPVMGALDGKNNNHWWLTTTNNWNSHCLQGVITAALTLIPDKLERAKYVTMGERYIKNYVLGFTPDGYCSEGMGYYNMGFVGYMLLRENIMQATGGKLDIFSENPYLINCALYPLNSELTPGVYPSIADCPSNSKPSPFILGYMSKVLGLGLPDESYTTIGQAGNLIRTFVSVMPEYAKKAPYLVGDFKLDMTRSYFNYAGILTVRNTPGAQPLMAAALKGGNNDEHHNHNDLGSYTIALGNEKLVEDPGLITYMAKTFGPERYTIKILASYGHAVPLIAGQEQTPGKGSVAVVTKTDFTPAQDIFSIDYASAYKAVVPSLESLTRDFVFKRGKTPSLTVTDNFSFSSPQTFESAIITRGEWRQIAPNKLEITRGEETLYVTITPPKGVTFKVSSEVIDEDIAVKKRGEAFTRIAVRLDAPQKAGTLAITYSTTKK